jgi:Arc/MetJ family transcription regulator
MNDALDSYSMSRIRSSLWPLRLYRQPMRKHTTIDLDSELFAEARRVLGTTTTTETIQAALADVVRRHRRMEILALHPALTLTDLDALRAHRFSEDPAP